MNHRGWILFSGALWMLIGGFLLYKGIGLFSQARFGGVNSFAFSDRTMAMLQFMAVMIGFAKGRFVLAKTAARIVLRIRNLSSPIRFSQVYPKSYWMLISSMVLLGISFSYFSIPADVRGFIDIAIGFALLYGAMHYFLFALPEDVRKWIRK